MIVASITSRLQRRKLKTAGKTDDFALPIAIALGFVMLSFAGLSIILAQGDRNTAVVRQTSAASILVSDSAMSRVLVLLTNPNNQVLLRRNYDPINPTTGTNYLGADTIPKSGDESATPIDEWTGYNPSNAPCYQQLGLGAPNLALTGSLDPNQTYTIRAYRYDQSKQLGTLLVEGNYRNQISSVVVTFSLQPVLDNFPSLLVTQPASWIGVSGLRGRQVLGSKGNIYYPPTSSADSSLTGYSKPGDSTRSSYRNAIYASSTQDGATGDPVGGTIFACKLQPNLPAITSGTYLGSINTSRVLQGTGSATPTIYQVDQINLINNDTLTVDTTGGPVYINITNKGNSGTSPESAITLRNNAKILNIRTDGQPPKVGDLRIMLLGNSQTNLYNTACIQNAFLYAPQDELRLLTTGPGCPGGQNTNFEGVVWAEEILSSKNSASNRPINYAGGGTNEFDTLITPGATSGIAVPDDVSSLVDTLGDVDWPIRYKYGAIQSWQRLR